MARKVFISFDSDDMNLKNLFTGQTKNPSNPLEFYDNSLKVAFDSSDADYVRRKIREMIRAVSVTVCLIGRNTYNSTWVKWELNESKDLGKGLLGVRLHNDSSDIVPSQLSGYEIVNWNTALVTSAIERSAQKAGY